MVKRKTGELVGPTIVGPRLSELAVEGGVTGYVKFGDRLASARAERDVTQQKLGEAIDKSRTTIVQYEKGDISPPLAIVERLAAALGSDPGFLAFGHGVGIAEEGERLGVRQDLDTESNSYFEFSSAISQQLRLTARNGCVFALPEDAPQFHLRRGDHLFVDVSRTVLQADGKLYAVRASAGDLAVVRTEIAFGEAGDRIRLTLGQGQISEVAVGEVKVVGLVRATLNLV